MKFTREQIDLQRVLVDAGLQVSGDDLRRRIEILRQDRRAARDDVDFFVLGWLDQQAGRHMMR